MSITVVDSIMGSGKSKWARKYMNEHPEKRWWYVTTYSEEVDKTVELCKSINMQQPVEDALRQGSNKSDHLKKLVDEGANIALTHKLFLIIEQTPELLDKIRSYEYSVIFDEVPNVVDPIAITLDDINMHIKAGTFEIDCSDGKLTWINEEYKGAADSLMPLTKTGNIYHPEEKSNSLVWLYNPEIFDAFQSIFILTYYYVGSRMYHYMKFYNSEFSIVQTNGEILLEHDDTIMETKSNYGKLIQIEHSNLNDIGSEGNFANTRFSSNWYDKPHNVVNMRRLFLNAYNFLHNKCHAPASKSLYTTFRKIADNDPLVSYKSSFLSCTTTSSNAYDDRMYLAYLVNIFENPAVKNFFNTRNIKYNEDYYAQNSMMQWIWRSCIRKHPPEPIRIYIPSVRMRELLEEWFTRPE